jgi:hypothetical protein
MKTYSHSYFKQEIEDWNSWDTAVEVVVIDKLYVKSNLGRKFGVQAVYLIHKIKWLQV